MRHVLSYSRKYRPSMGEIERFERRIRQTRKKSSITWRAFGVGKSAKVLSRSPPHDFRSWVRAKRNRRKNTQNR